MRKWGSEKDITGVRLVARLFECSKVDIPNHSPRASAALCIFRIVLVVFCVTSQQRTMTLIQKLEPDLATTLVFFYYRAVVLGRFSLVSAGKYSHICALPTRAPICQTEHELVAITKIFEIACAKCSSVFAMSNL